MSGSQGAINGSLDNMTFSGGTGTQGTFTMAASDQHGGTASVSFYYPAG